MTRVTPSKALELMNKTTATLDAVHAITGAKVRCGWDDYCAVMVGHYGCDRPSLDALARLGRFHWLEGVPHWFGSAGYQQTR